MVKKSSTKKTTTKKTTSSKKSTATPTPPTPPTPPTTKTPPTTTTAVVPETTELSFSGAFIELLGQLTSLRSQLTTITGKVRVLQKRTERELKAAKKASKKRSRAGGKARAPSGFVKPTLISLELANFLGRDQGTLLARTAVTREINAYIRAHSLQDPSNGRRILPDTKLRKLLKVGKTEELTYFNLQRYMSPHFQKAGHDFPQGNTILK